MNPQKVVNALILRETRYKEADKILTILSAENGKQTVRARGCMRKGSRLSVGCQLFCFSELTLFENRVGATADEASPINMFLGLRSSVEKLALAAYVAEVTEALADSDAAVGELLRLSLNTFYAISELDTPHWLIKSGFEVKSAALAGYEPVLDCCAVCEDEQPKEPVFSPSLGGLCCRACAVREQAEHTECPPDAVVLLKYFVNAPLNRLFPSLPSGMRVPEAETISERYLADCLETSFKSLNYYKEISK